MEYQSGGFELDHLFVAVPGPDVGASALEGAGFLAGPSNRHPGQGTESRGILFENVYLELIWLSDPQEAASPPIQRTRLGERLAPGSEACPFGLGLRRQAEIEVRLPFESWEYRPPYLPEGLYFRMGVNSENLGEPLLFFLPWLSEPAWPTPEHPNGTKRVTALAMALEGKDQASPTLASLADAGIASFSWGSPYFLDVELDEGRLGRTLDLRPEIPLRLSW